MDKKTLVFNSEMLSRGKVFGISRYERELYHRLDNAEDFFRDFRVILAYPSGRPQIGDYRNIECVELGNAFSSAYGQRVWRDRVLPDFLERNGYVGVDLEGMIPLRGFACASLLDCIVERCPEEYPSVRERMWRSRFRKRIKSLAESDIPIITLTRDSARDIEHCYGVSPSRIRLVPCGWEHITQIEANSAVFEVYPELRAGDYLFTLGSVAKHKNTEWVVRCAESNPDVRFVVSGSLHGTYGAEMKRSAPGNVVFTGYLDDASMKSLLMSCRALILPSFLEGFGLPPIEALALGKQAIVSDIACFREVYGETVHYINPDDPEVDIEGVLASKVSPSEDVLEKYTWDNAAEALKSVLFSL